MRSVVVSLVALTATAWAQPSDPYAPTPAPRPAPAPRPVPKAPPADPVTPEDPYAPPAPRPGEDPVLFEQIAEQLVQRAQELLDAKVYLDAKQLAVEAMVKSPHGGAAERAKLIVHTVNVQLGIPEDNGPSLNPPGGKVDLKPITDPTIGDLDKQPLPPPEGEIGHAALATSVHGGLYAGLLGATVGSFFSHDNPAAGAVPTGLVAGLAAGYYLPRLVDRLHWSEAKIRTAGAASVWGGVIGGFIADLPTSDTHGRSVLVGASIGATVGLVGGALFASSKGTLTRGDVALIDTFAGVGTLGGLTIGMLMQPAQTEAYSLNAILGATAGIVVGFIAAPQTNTTQRRMLRVAGISLLGGALPFLLYAGIHDPTQQGDERITGLLSTAGLIGGLYLGFRLTAHMDEGLDTLDGKPKPADDAPPAIVGRNSDGRWTLGGVGLQPLSPQLAPQHGMAFEVLSGRF